MIKNGICYLLILFPALAFGQKTTVSYQIEPANRDSFYLVEYIYRPIEGMSRQQELITPMIFPDTSVFKTYVAGLKKQYDEMEARLKQSADEAEFLAAKIRVLDALKREKLNIKTE